MDGVATALAALEPRRWGNRRIMIAAHGHPELSNGGAEVAAFQLFSRLRARAGCKAWYLGCDRSVASYKAGAVLSQPFSDAEYIYAAGTFDWFKFANRDPRFPREIERLFKELAPEIVHFHHYSNFGIEVFQHLKRVLPNCRIVLTLHEYLAICNHYGQMITREHRNLCYQASPSRCQKCFPELTTADFFLRKLYVQRYLDLVDVFISPSAFLAERYVAWGIPASKMIVLENLVAETSATPVPAPPAAGPLRIAFFGQISILKGIDVVLDAAAILDKEGVASVSFEIFGDHRSQPPEFQTAFLKRSKQVGQNVHFNGPYDQLHVDRLMQSVHAVLVPSIWWENSPVVIQEALRNRRPVICSDIGGMAEKVRDGVDGFHFAAGNAMALASLIKKFIANPDLLEDVTQLMTGRPAKVSTIDDYIAIYDN